MDEELHGVLLDGEGASLAESVLYCSDPKCHKRFTPMDRRFLCESCGLMFCKSSLSADETRTMCKLCNGPRTLGVTRSIREQFVRVRGETAMARDGASYTGYSSLLTSLRAAPQKSLRRSSLSLFGLPDCYRVNWRPSRSCARCNGPTDKDCCGVCGCSMCERCVRGQFLAQHTSTGVILCELGARDDTWVIDVCGPCCRVVRNILRTTTTPKLSPIIAKLIETHTTLTAFRTKITSLLGPFRAVVDALSGESAGRDVIARMSTLEYDLSTLFSQLAAAMQVLPQCRTHKADRVAAAVSQAFVEFYRERLWVFRQLTRNVAEILPEGVRTAIASAVDVRALTSSCALIHQLAFEATAFEDLALPPLLIGALDATEAELRRAVDAAGRVAGRTGSAGGTEGNWDSHLAALKTLVRESARASPLILSYFARPPGWRASLAAQCDRVLCVVLRELSVRSSHARSQVVCAALEHARVSVKSLLTADGADWVVL